MRCYNRIIIFVIISLLFLPLGADYPGVGSEREVSVDINEIASPDPKQSHTRGEGRVITSADLIWPMFGKDKQHTFIANPTPKGIFTPDEKWTHSTNIDSLGAAVGNFNPNIFGTTGKNVNYIVFSDNGILFIVDGEKGESVWELDVDLIDSSDDNDQVYTAPAIGDFNKNGKMDIVFAVDDAANNSYVYAYEPVIRVNATGYYWDDNNYVSEKLWEKYTGVDMSYSSPVITDLDGDSYLDIIIGGADTDAWLFALSGKDGTALSGNWPYKLSSGSRTSTPAIYEFGANSRVVVTSIEFDTYYVYVVSKSGQTLHQRSIDMNLPIALAYDVVPSPAVGQLNRSSTGEEIVVVVPVVTSQGRVYSLSNDLSILWSTTYTAGQFESSPAIVDIDNDENGDMDVIVASWDSFGTHLYAIEGRTGARIWDQYKNLGVGVQSIIASPALVDINNDLRIDAVFAVQDELFAINGSNGEYLWNFSLPPPQSGARLVRSSPAVGDIDKDKFLDVFIDGSLISHYIIDLTLSPDDVEFSVSELIQGQETSITAIIHNAGQAEAEGVVVSFLENGVLIDNSTIESIPGGETRGATVSWIPEESGDRTLTIDVDPDNAIEEIVENNNRIDLKVTIIAAFPDLTFDEIKFYRGDGKQVDNINTHLIENEESRISAVVRNVGGLKAENILVRFRENGIKLGVEQLIGSLEVNRTEEVGVNWTPVLGYHSVDAVVDPVDGISEANETNNNIAEPGLYVKTKEPGDAGYTMTAMVYKPDGSSAAPGAQYIITNERTQNFITGATSSGGRYNRDLKELVDGYLEGDKISIFVSDGSNESFLTFKAYSEDKSRHDNITLSKLPRYSISMSVEDDAKDVDPASSAVFDLSIENRGNTNNSIILNHTKVIDVNSNSPAVNWSVNLDAYSIDDLAEGAKIIRQLTIRPPSKGKEAVPGQVVRVTVDAESAYDDSQKDSVTVYATLTRKYLITLDVTPVMISLNPALNPTAVFNLNITNLGNGPDHISITTSNVTLDVINIDVNSPVEVETEESVSLPLSVNIQPSHPMGYYYLSVHARSEDGSSVQTKHLTVQISRPDLSVSKSDIQLPSILPSIGETMSITAKIHNNGTAAANFVDVEIIKDIDSLATETIDFISENSFKYVTLRFTLTEAGTYNMKLLVDPQNLILESDEDNNEASFSFELRPDLTFVGSLGIDNDNPKAGDKVNLDVTLTNIGEVAVSTSFEVEFGYYRDSDSGKKKVSIKKVTVDEQILSKGTKQVSIEWKARSDISSIYCFVDSGRDIWESKENNNEILLNITVSESAPDTAEGGTETYTILAAVVFVIIIIAVVYFWMVPAKEPEEEDDQKKKKKRGREGERKRGREEEREKRREDERKSVPRRKKGSVVEVRTADPIIPASAVRKDIEEVDEHEENEDEGVVTSIIGGVKGLNPFAEPKKKRRKIKRKKAVTAKELFEDKKAGRSVPGKPSKVQRDDYLEKIKKADSLIKSRELSDKERMLERRSQILKKRESELKTVKDDLVEIGIIEADVLDDLEKEEIEEADEDDAMEVEPIE